MAIPHDISTGALKSFHAAQLEKWPMARENFRALGNVAARTLTVDGIPFIIQHNPARIASTGAKIDKASIAARPCFLCAANRPSEQASLDAGEYEILVNPFPIFPLHFTVPAKEHVPQLITADRCRRFADMAELSSRLPGLALFYNGPACGASAPDHFHFQIVEQSRLPIFDIVERGELMPFRIVTGQFASAAESLQWFSDVCAEMASFPQNAGEPEPRMNVLCTAVALTDGTQAIRVIVIPRRAHRPSFYGTGDGQVLLSPASVDLGGVMVAPSPRDFNTAITPELLSALLDEVCYRMP